MTKSHIGKTGTSMEASKRPFQMWDWAIYLERTSHKEVGAIKLHRYLVPVRLVHATLDPGGIRRGADRLRGAGRGGRVQRWR